MHDLGFVPSEDLGQRKPSLEPVEQPAIGEIEVDPRRDPQDLGGTLGLGEADVRPRRLWRRLAIGQIDDPHSVPFACQQGQSPAAGDLHVVGMPPTAIRSSSGSCTSAMRLLTSRTCECDQPSIQYIPSAASHNRILARASPDRSGPRPVRPGRAMFDQSSDGSRLVTARRNVGAIASNRSRSICSIPRAIETFQTFTWPASPLSV